MSDSDTESVCYSSDQFKIAVKEWVMINDQLAETRKIVSERNKRKKQLAQVICSFMKENDKEICNLGENGILQMRKQKTQATLNKVHLHKWIGEFFQDEEKAKQLTEFVFDKKKEESVEKDVLKRSSHVV